MNDKDKLAIFDLDGTLFNTDEVNFHAYVDAFGKYGVKLDHDYYVNECNGRHYTTFAPIILNGNLEHMEDIHELKKVKYNEYLKYAKINAHLFDVINSIKDTYKIAIVTTASEKNVEDILSFFEVRDLFDLLITGEDISAPKPDPEGFLIAMDYYDISPDRCVIYEDSDVGIEAARTTGSAVIIVDKF